MENTTPRPQSFRGVVVGTKMKDTATVAVSRYVKHPKYKKYRTLTKKYQTHDVGNTAKVGDQVTIVACRPVSKLKRFAIKSIDKVAETVETVDA